MENKKMLIGLHLNESHIYNNDDHYTVGTESTEIVDFLTIHFDPKNKTYEENIANAEKLAEVTKEKDIDFIINYEEQNFIYDMKGPDGFEWANREDGTHRMIVPKELQDAFNKCGTYRGTMYDELEHCIINRNTSIAIASKFKLDIPTFVPSSDNNLLKQGRLLDSQIKEYATQLKDEGSETVSGEHVWPVLFHRFASQGIIPNFKSQKESCSNIAFATAAGAAIEYKTPLWNCVDLWCRNTFPGHSPEEMYDNLRFAYLMGINRVYVEAPDPMVKDGKKTPYGELYKKFYEEYKGKDRDYDIQDYKPEIGIIRYDDSYWGQGTTPLIWKNMLLGNPEIKVKKESREWVQAFNIITRGETGNSGLSYGQVSLALFKKHRSFASMNGTAVFDDKVRKDSLGSLKLCFLCGYNISDGTLKDIGELVKEGLTVVTTPKYAPEGIRYRGSYTEVKDGEGTWIIVSSFKHPKLRKRLKHFLGNKGEMTYTIGENNYRMKISEDGSNFELI